MRIGLICALVLLPMSGCIQWPDVDAPLASRGTGDWPELQPTATLPGPATTGDAEKRASATLQGRAAALRRRAILMRTPVTDPSDFDRLRALLAR